MKPDVAPKFDKNRPLPLAMKERVEKEIDRLEEANIISPVKFSEWAAPVVPVIKKDSTIRLCGDYKVTVNQAANTEVLKDEQEHLATLCKVLQRLQEVKEGKCGWGQTRIEYLGHVIDGRGVYPTRTR